MLTFLQKKNSSAILEDKNFSLFQMDKNDLPYKYLGSLLSQDSQ